MKNLTLIIALFLLFVTNCVAQEIKTDKDIGYWERSNAVGLDLTQVSFVNWNAGGQNSISALAKGQFQRRFIKGRFLWNNELIARYGFNKQVDREYRKTDDVIQINSTAGYKTDSISNWYYTAKFNFNTQFTSGYNYPNTDVAISKPFAPAYVFLGIGTEYVDKPRNITAYFSPLTMKTTLVMDQRLADSGAFGVQQATYDDLGNLLRHGRKDKTELGALITATYKAQIWENIDLDARTTFYSDYLNKFGNIDVDLQLNLSMKVNKYVRASIISHLIYDDDIKAVKEIEGENVKVGPRIQLKQILGVGVAYTF